MSEISRLGICLLNGATPPAGQPPQQLFQVTRRDMLAPMYAAV
ncbi:MAG: hypothetical protein AABY83_06340 [Pseudomonadota bacterium]